MIAVAPANTREHSHAARSKGQRSESESGDIPVAGSVYWDTPSARFPVCSPVEDSADGPTSLSKSTRGTKPVRDTLNRCSAEIGGPQGLRGGCGRPLDAESVAMVIAWPGHTHRSDVRGRRFGRGLANVCAVFLEPTSRDRPELIRRFRNARILRPPRDFHKTFRRYSSIFADIPPRTVVRPRCKCP